MEVKQQMALRESDAAEHRGQPLLCNRLRPSEADTQKTVEFLAHTLPKGPQAAIVLGSGLGSFVEAIVPELSLPYGKIPGIPQSTAIGHAGYLHVAEILETPTVVLQGRCHRYEGYSRSDVTRLVRALCTMGIETLIVSCAAGGLNPRYRVGDLMLFDSHIDQLGTDPTPLSESASSPDPVLDTLYPERTLRQAEQVAREERVSLQRGTYVGVKGPNYETRAEIRWLRAIGGDAVGMSSIPEILAARRYGVQTIGLAMITNECQPDRIHPASADDVLQAATHSEPAFRKLTLSLLARTGQGRRQR